MYALCLFLFFAMPVQFVFMVVKKAAKSASSSVQSVMFFYVKHGRLTVNILFMDFPVIFVSCVAILSFVSCVVLLKRNGRIWNSTSFKFPVLFGA